MASAKLAVALAAVLVVCAALAAQANPYYPAEPCERQTKYFMNCVSRGYGEKCCDRGVVSDSRCLCMLEQEAEVRCIPKRPCPIRRSDAKAVKLAELKLSCMKNLQCKRA